MAKICIVDYKGGNIFSVQNTVNSLGADSYLSSDPSEIKKADKILFPGVGSFHSAMQHIQGLGLKEVLTEKALSGIPFLGICVGMQVLFESSTEAPLGQSHAEGLKIFAGKYEKFDFDKKNFSETQKSSPKTESSKLKIPHMGWNQIQRQETNTQNPSHENPLFKGVSEDASFYFVHSFMTPFCKTSTEKNLLKFPKVKIFTTNYGVDFISSIWNGENLFACQFHPEKSGENGLKVIKNFIEL